VINDCGATINQPSTYYRRFSCPTLNWVSSEIFAALMSSEDEDGSATPVRGPIDQ
jgi:hypothetical protein